MKYTCAEAAKLQRKLNERPARARRLAGGNPARQDASRITDSESWTGDGNRVS